MYGFPYFFILIGYFNQVLMLPILLIQNAVFLNYSCNGNLTRFLPAAKLLFVFICLVLVLLIYEFKFSISLRIFKTYYQF